MYLDVSMLSLIVCLRLKLNGSCRGDYSCMFCRKHNDSKNSRQVRSVESIWGSEAVKITVLSFIIYESLMSRVVARPPSLVSL